MVDPLSSFPHVRGHPLGRASTDKKVLVPNFFLFIGLSQLPTSFCSAEHEPVISSIDSGRLSAGHCLRRGDPFSHPSGSSARWQVRAIHPTLNRKELGGNAQSQFPPARLFCSTVRIALGAVLVKSDPATMNCFHLSPARPTRGCESRKRSVPLRVHSVFKRSGFVSPLSALTSNPFLTHGSVESPAKVFPAVSTL